MKALLTLIITAVLLSNSAQAAPKAELWPFWLPNHQAAISAYPQFQIWQNFLDKYLQKSSDGINKVAYAAVTEADQRTLKNLLQQISNTDPRRWPDNKQKAFWINTYNLTVVSLVLDYYPVESIKDIRPSFSSLFNAGPWEDKYIKVIGQELSLNDIEHRILRPVWPDHRLHFALNCASIGCPNLATDIYQPDTLETQLNAAEDDFLQHNRAVFWQAESGALQLSSIFDWYQQDFAGNETQLLEYLRREAALSPAVINHPKLKIRYAYDWNLNAEN